MESSALKIGLALVGLALIGGAALWVNQPEPEPPKDEMELLADEFIELNCPRPTNADSLASSEVRTLEVMARMKEIVGEKETSEEVNQARVRVMDLIKCPESE